MHTLHVLRHPKRAIPRLCQNVLPSSSWFLAFCVSGCVDFGSDSVVHENEGSRKLWWCELWSRVCVVGVSIGDVCVFGVCDRHFGHPNKVVRSSTDETFTCTVNPPRFLSLSYTEINDWFFLLPFPWHYQVPIPATTSIQRIRLDHCDADGCVDRYYRSYLFQ